MDININLANSATSLEMDEVIFSQVLTDINLHAQETIANGVSCALLTSNGKTLAHAIVNDSRAVLDTNTVECVEYVASLPIEATRGAYIVIGESEKPLAIVPVQLAKNPIADIAPPTESAPVYPTHEDLLAILAQMQEVQRNVIQAERNVGELVNGFDVTIADGVAQVNEASQQATNAIAQKVAEGETAISDATSQGVTTVETASEGALSDIDAKVAEAETTINAKVTQTQIHATQATRSATQAQASANSASRSATQAEEARDEAVVALNNGCVYEVREVTDANLALDKTLTAYKHTPTADTTYVFNVPQDAQGKIVVFWLWIAMGETAYTLTFPSNVTWINEPTFAVNTQCMLALMSVDGGATWQANVQWEM